MKVLQINASYKPAYIYGGPTMSVSKLSEEMVKAGCAVEVFTTTANGTEELNVAPNSTHMIKGVTVTYFKRVTKDHSHLSPTLLKRLRRVVKRFDVVHIHAWWNLVSLLTCFIAIKSRVPVLISPRVKLSVYSFSNRNSLKKKLLHIIMGKYLLRNSFFHVTSDQENAAIRKLTEPKGVFNIPNFIKLPEKSQIEEPRLSATLKIIFLSRIEEKKGLEILFDALVDVALPYQLTIAGDGKPDYINKLKALAKRNCIETNVVWVGFRKDDKFEILHQHHLLVLPSYDENFGNVVVESLSVGTAVLISKNVGLSYYVKENNFGWICDNNATAFKESIQRVDREREKLGEIRERAPIQIREDFDEIKLRTRYIDMYHQVIHND